MPSSSIADRPSCNIWKSLDGAGRKLGVKRLTIYYGWIVQLWSAGRARPHHVDCTADKEFITVLFCLHSTGNSCTPSDHGYLKHVIKRWVGSPRLVHMSLKGESARLGWCFLDAYCITMITGTTLVISHDQCSYHS